MLVKHKFNLQFFLIMVQVNELQIILVKAHMFWIRLQRQEAYPISYKTVWVAGTLTRVRL